MGLDISLRVNNDSEVITPEYFENDKLYSLSREFCNLMCRPGVVEHTPEFDQIGVITNIDISHLYKMTEYPSEEEEIDMIEFAENEEEKERLKADFKKRKQDLNGNINQVKILVEKLINSLEKIDNLYERLIKTDFDSMNSEYYFSDFNKDKGEGYIRNNFGQDLRNFKRFIDYAIDRNSETIWFEYG
ncbi:MAG: hypothetical protein HRU50_13885 [Winogradskyella sp.]|uniref:hypothetical protein n=1 Tax=Winogradskyella sp. TaxID=1883156 RepID=UPI002600E497|nr:hypothetical protein [Winogradskyella sp.]NRB61016.1 hypothetical protein [Winogradskyella sp.]